MVAEKLYQGRNDYESGVILYGLFLASKINYCLTIDNYGVIQEHKSFKGIKDSKLILDRSHYFKMLEDKKISAMLPRPWNKLRKEILYQRRWDFVINVMIKECVLDVIIKLKKIKKWKIIYV